MSTKTISSNVILTTEL